MTDKNDADLLAEMGTDALEWAQQFLKVVAERPAPELDEAFMTGWFANAIEAGRSTQYTRSMPHLAFQANQTAHEKGWWDSGRAFDGVIALIHSEASEALEEWRNNHKEDEVYYTIPDYRPDPSAYEGSLRDAVFHLLRRNSHQKFLYRSTLDDLDDHEVDLLVHTGFLKPEGIPSELADIIIRVFDAAVEYGIDIEEEVINKMAYNATRLNRHGGKRA